MMEPVRVEVEIDGKLFYMETGVLAKQASGSVVVGCEETIILSAVAAEDSPRDPNSDFLPLTVEYRDRTSAAGRIPGGFLRRESRPSDLETLTSRLVDRSVRPMFKSGYVNETQIMITPLSFDYENPTDILALNGASASLLVSDLPFHEAVSGVRIGRVDGQLVVNPTIKQQAEGDMLIIVAGTSSSITMVEGGGNQITEDELVEALELANFWIKKLCALQNELAKKYSKPKIEVAVKDLSEEVSMIASKLDDKMREAVLTEGKFNRSKAMKALRDQAIDEILQSDEVGSDEKQKLKDAFDIYQKKFIRNMILKDRIRVDRRALDQIREITSAVDVLPRTHGSSLFTRGETQALVTTTLGSVQDQQTIEKLEGRVTRRFMLHYNFPSFCVNEVKKISGPGRREIGHGMLAERALEYVLPDTADFGYTIRLVSDILESNGSSSMATVCGGSLALMDAGVPIKSAVAGIAMGLVKEGDDIAILSDILGLEDALGDFDFKVAGTKDGITAVQMDIKIKDGLKVDIMKQALEQARQGRLHILDKMGEAISTYREDLNPNAPRVHSIYINPEKIGALIGPGGKVIKGIIEETGCSIDVNDSGKVDLFAKDNQSLEAALEIVNSICQEAKIGNVYIGNVKKIVEFGAFIEIFPGTEGLCHISELSHTRTAKVEDELSLGDSVMVKVLDIAPNGKISLSRKSAMKNDSDQDDSSSSSNKRSSRPRRDRSSFSGRESGGRTGGDRSKPRDTKSYNRRSDRPRRDKSDY